MCVLGIWMQKCPQCNKRLHHGRQEPKICREAGSKGRGELGRCSKGVKQIPVNLTGHLAFKLCSEECRRKKELAAARESAAADDKASSSKRGCCPNMTKPSR